MSSRKDVKPIGLKNLRVTGTRRRRRKPGEVFVFSVRPDEYYWGRVISLEYKLGYDWGFAILVYLYRVATRDTIEIPQLRREELLIAPRAVDTSPWRVGVFDTIAFLPLLPEDIWERHCFAFPNAPGKYFDGFGNQVDGPFYPLGENSVSTYLGVDKLVSQALAIPY